MTAKKVITVTGDRCSSSNTRRKVLTVVGHTPVDNTARKRKAEMRTRRYVLSIAGNHPEAKTGGMFPSGKSSKREVFSIADARHVMGIDWMGMKELSQVIPPAYAEWIGRQAKEVLDWNAAMVEAALARIEGERHGIRSHLPTEVEAWQGPTRG